MRSHSWDVHLQLSSGVVSSLASCVSRFSMYIFVSFFLFEKLRFQKFSFMATISLKQFGFRSGYSKLIARITHTLANVISMELIAAFAPLNLR